MKFTRRHFVRTGAAAAAGIAAARADDNPFAKIDASLKEVEGAIGSAEDSLAKAEGALNGPVIGHGSHRYRVAEGWGVLDAAKYPVAHCHEMVEDSKGRIVLFQTNAKNNILIYDKGGKLLESWGTEYPGAHGMDIVNENGEEFLFLTDTNRRQVYKTTMKGKVVMTLGWPEETGKYKDEKGFAPTNVMPAPDGSFYVGDGYGSSWIMHYDNAGKLKNVFGGPGKNPENVNTPHGGIVDTRDPGNVSLVICSRADNALKRFKLDGTYIDTTPLPGMRVCQLAQRGDFLYAPHLEGLISVIDKDFKVVSNPGGKAPEYKDGALQKLEKEGETFVHPHGIWVDEEESVYVAQWNSGNTYPVKLERASA
ncbi:MAG: hypothetical protein R3F11_27040 [Verrucomicrobiales bacterium]